MKKVIIQIINKIGITNFLRKKNHTPMVLFWHGVDDNPDPIVEAECISTSEFEKEIQYLMKHYEIISMDEFYSRYKTHSFTNKEVVLTFDDGYKNNLTKAAPILKKYNLPFTIFISTNYITTGRRFYASIPRLTIVGGKLMQLCLPEYNISYDLKSEDELISKAFEIEEYIKTLNLKDALSLTNALIEACGDKYKAICNRYKGGEVMTWNDIRTLSNEYDCTIAAHTCDHICCHYKQDIDIVKAQLIDSKKKIEEETGRECKYFSFPNGNYTSRAMNLVRNVYDMGFSTEARPVYTGGENIANVARVSAAKDSEKFKLLIATRTNLKGTRIFRAPSIIYKKINYYFKWFLFRIAQLGCLNPISPKLRPWLWKKIGVNIKGDVCIGYDVYFDVGNAHLITIEDGVWITSRSLLLCHKRDMGDYNKGDDYNMLPYIKEPIHLKKGCCIGMASIIMPGVTVGEGSVVGTGSLVTKDVPDWVIVTGRPAKIVKEL